MMTNFKRQSKNWFKMAKDITSQINEINLDILDQGGVVVAYYISLKFKNYYTYPKYSFLK